jgi:hypothetical protein
MTKSTKIKNASEPTKQPRLQPFAAPPAQYLETDREKLELHKSFLQGIQKDELARLTVIETKTSQLFSQTGIIIAILGFFVPLIVDKLDAPLLRLTFIGLLFIAAFFYLRTIHSAGKNLNIRKFKYPRSKAETVLDPDLRTVNQFHAEEIRDLLHSIPIHVDLNNKKGSNLLKAHNSFKIANILTAVLSIALCITISITFRKSEITKVTVDGTVKTEQSTEHSAPAPAENAESPSSAARAQDSPQAPETNTQASEANSNDSISN